MPFFHANPAHTLALTDRSERNRSTPRAGDSRAHSRIAVVADLFGGIAQPTLDHNFGILGAGAQPLL